MQASAVFIPLACILDSDEGKRKTGVNLVRILQITPLQTPTGFIRTRSEKGLETSLALVLSAIILANPF